MPTASWQTLWFFSAKNSIFRKNLKNSTHLGLWHMMNGLPILFFGLLAIVLLISCSQKHNRAIKTNVKFTNATDLAGVLTRPTLGGHGAIAGDVNGDGLVDLFYTHTVTRGQEDLFINQGNGTFKEESVKRGADDPQGGSHGMVLVDFDCDGDFDIWNGATGGANHVYLNDGKGYFTDITREAGILNQYAATRGVTAGDINGDGLPDLVAVNPSWANEIYINLGSARFTVLGDVKDARNNFGIDREYAELGLYSVGALLDLGLPEERDHSGLKQGVSLSDFDGDGDMDLFSCIWEYPVHVIMNQGDGRFALGNDKKIFGVNPNDYTGSTFCDLNNDGLLDCVLAGDSVTAVFKNRGNGTFKDMTPRAALLGHGYHVAAGDVDNDGLLDLYVTRSYETNLLYRNLGDFRFELLDNAAARLDSVAASKADCRSASFVDYDDDGDLDLWVAYKRHRGELFRNELKSGNKWVNVQLFGPCGDAGAVGTQVWIFENGHVDDQKYLVGYQQAQAAYGYMGQNDPVLHFGIGKRKSVDVKVRFLNGSEAIKIGIQAGQKIIITGKE